MSQKLNDEIGAFDSKKSTKFVSLEQKEVMEKIMAISRPDSARYVSDSFDISEFALNHKYSCDDGHQNYHDISEKNKQSKYITMPYELDFVQLMWPVKLERKPKSLMGGALGLYYPGLNYAVIDDLLYGDNFNEVWVHEAIHRDNGASEQNVRERTKYRVGKTFYH